MGISPGGEVATSNQPNTNLDEKELYAPSDDFIQSDIAMLSQRFYIWHPWAHFNMIRADGMAFFLSSHEIDVDNDGKGHGIGILKRMRFIPIGTVLKPKVSEHRGGFASTPNYLGSPSNERLEANALDLASIVSGSSVNQTAINEPTRVDPRYTLNDIMHAFSKYGCTFLNGLMTVNHAQHKRVMLLERVIFAGVDRDTMLLEDLGEYLGDSISPYLPSKAPTEFPEGNAYEQIERAAGEGLLINVAPSGQPEEAILTKLHPKEVEIAETMVSLMKDGVRRAHDEAVGERGVLAIAVEDIGQRKRPYNKMEKWLTSQFPNFEMHTDEERANRQLKGVMQNMGGVGAGPAPAGGVPTAVHMQTVEQLAEANKKILDQESRLTRIETVLDANALGAEAEAPPPAAPAENTSQQG